MIFRVLTLLIIGVGLLGVMASYMQEQWTTMLWQITTVCFAVVADIWRVRAGG